MARPIRVLVVDDTPAIRESLAALLATDPAIAVAGVTNDLKEVVQHVRARAPDVIVLDVEMPRMSGLRFLENTLVLHPMPFVICASLTDRGLRTAFASLESGAVDLVSKPRVDTQQAFDESAIRICDAVKAAASARVQRGVRLASNLPAKPEPRPARAAVPQRVPSERVVVIGASTGGTEALRSLLAGFPADGPGAVIVQHMPERFTAEFASRLNARCRATVKEAAHGDPVLRGQVLIAPGNLHLRLERGETGYIVAIEDGPLICRHRPSIDVLFRSAARCAGKNAIGVIMTGMGDDGVQGLREMKEAGAQTIAQNKATCLVYGMPASAIKLRAAKHVLPLEQIAPEILRLCQ